jgi:hypothetical protein
METPSRRFSVFAPRQREAVHKEQLPFLEGQQRLAVRAVNGASSAFIGAQRRPLTGEAGGLGAGFGQEGQVGQLGLRSRVKRYAKKRMCFQPCVVKKCFFALRWQILAGFPA